MKLLRIQDPFLFPFKRLNDFFSSLIESNSAWFYLLNKLLSFSQNDYLISTIFDSCPFSLKEYSEESEKFYKEQDFSRFSFSLQEHDSATHLTPFHLSFYSESKASAKQKGQYFTPSYISDFIVKKSLKYLLSSNSNLTEMVFGDIACGSGNLLIPLLNQLYNLSLIQLNTVEFYKFISTNIYGFDTDPISLWISKMRILFFLTDKIPDFSPSVVNLNLYHSDTLKALKINRNKEVDEAFFDLIILNPPYMNYGLRNAQKYDKEFRNFLRNRFFSAEYKLSLYPIFMERSIELLKDNGILGIITPDSYLLGRFYSKIRSYLLQNTNILDISLLGFEPFTGVTLGRPTITFLKKTNIPPKLPFPTRWIPSFSSFVEEKWKEYSNNQDEFSSNFHNRFHLFFNQQDEEFIKDWKNKSSKLIQDIVSIHTGIRSKIGQKNIISKTKKSHTWKKGIISSSQVKPFFLDNQNHWINVEPSILWAGGFKKEVNENPKLLVRQTGYQIVTCVDLDGFYHLNNCHSISPRSKETNLFSLATILNSTEFNRLYHILSMEKGRALAQVDIEFLLKLPIPTIIKEGEKKLEDFYWMKNKTAMKDDSFVSYSLFDLIEKT